jgi:hypothetical protein
MLSILDRFEIICNSGLIRAEWRFQSLIGLGSFVTLEDSLNQIFR